MLVEPATSMYSSHVQGCGEQLPDPADTRRAAIHVLTYMGFCVVYVNAAAGC